MNAMEPSQYVKGIAEVEKVFVKVENEDSLDISDEKIPSDIHEFCFKEENKNCIGSSKSQDLSAQFHEVYIKVEKEDYAEDNPEADESLEDNIHQVFVKTKYGENLDEPIPSDDDEVYVDEEDPLENSDDVNTLHTVIDKQKMYESPQTSSWLTNENGDGINYLEYNKSVNFYNSEVQDIKEGPEEDISTHFPNSGTSELIMGEPSFNFVATTNLNHGIQTEETVYVRCDHCGTSKPTKEDLQKHIFSAHYANFVESGTMSDSGLHKCHLCAKEFIYKSHLVNHIRIHNGKKPHKCDICSYSTMVPSLLKRHYCKHTGEKPYKCDVCDYSTAVPYHLKRHSYKHTGEMPYKCKLCDYHATESSSLKIHMRRHDGEKPYQCDQCNFKTVDSSSFNRHFRKHSEIGMYKCNRCEFSTGFKSSLTAHKRQHIGMKYKCELCTYSTSRKMHFEAHLRKHTGENLFRCHLCDYTTLRKEHLVVHMRKHTGEKPYKCTTCDYRSAQSSQLKIHLRKHTGEKPFKCTQCDYRTAQRSHLKAHAYKHGGVKPFSCNVCEYATVMKSDLKVHMTKHTGEMLNCQHCEFKTHNQSALRRHVRTHIEAKKLLKDSGTS